MLDGQTLYDYVLLLISLSTSFLELRVGHINKHNFFSIKFKIRKVKLIHFFYLDD